MKVELNIRDLYKIESGLVRDHEYWRKTRRKDVRMSERIVTLTGIKETLGRVRTAIEEYKAAEQAEAESVAAAANAEADFVVEDDEEFTRHLEAANAEASGSAIVQQVQEGHR